jgi:hypothetical protein
VAGANAIGWQRQRLARVDRLARASEWNGKRRHRALLRRPEASANHREWRQRMTGSNEARCGARARQRIAPNSKRGGDD